MGEKPKFRRAKSLNYAKSHINFSFSMKCILVLLLIYTIRVIFMRGKAIYQNGSHLDELQKEMVDLDEKMNTYRRNQVLQTPLNDVSLSIKYLDSIPDKRKEALVSISESLAVEMEKETKRRKENGENFGLPEARKSMNSGLHQAFEYKSLAYKREFEFTSSFRYITSQPETSRSFPIVIICYNREDQLRETLNSLLQVRHVNRDKILGLQDGDKREVAEVFEAFGIQYKQRIATKQEEADYYVKRKFDAGRKICAHYKWALNKAFEVFPDAPNVIVFEDDFRFSPDIIEYFNLAAPLVEHDSTLFTASAWNDNGFDGVAQDSEALHRTDFFPGLGWLLSQDFWNSVKNRWPKNHWDWFLRNPLNNNKKDSLYPEVPRTKHMGIFGTFMDKETQEKYFDRAIFQQDEKFVWDQEEFPRLAIGPYERRLESELINAVHVFEGKDIFEHKGVPKVIWYEANPRPSLESRVKPLMAKLGLWHQIMRGQRKGVMPFWYAGERIYLINTFTPESEKRKQKSEWYWGFSRQTPWLRLKPADLRPFSPDTLLHEITKAEVQLFGSTNPPKLREEKAKDEVRFTSEVDKNFIVAASETQTGESCENICKKVNRQCEVRYLHLINRCEVLESNFGCRRCEGSVGGDQPAYDTKSRICLLNTEPDYFSCHGHFTETRRLCVCV